MSKILSAVLLALFFIGLLLYAFPSFKSGDISFAQIGGFIALTVLCVCILTDADFVLNLLNLLEQNAILIAAILLVKILLFLNIKN